MKRFIVNLVCFSILFSNQSFAQPPTDDEVTDWYIRQTKRFHGIDSDSYTRDLFQIEDKTCTIETIPSRSEEHEVTSVLFKPKAEGRHPLFVHLHGGDEKKDAFNKRKFSLLILEMLTRGFAVLCPNFTKETPASDIKSVLDKIKTRDDLDPNSMYLHGFSNGATVGFRVLPQLASYFSGVHLQVGFFSELHDYDLDSIPKELPLFFSVAGRDEEASPERALTLIEALHKKGNNVDFHMMKNGGHHMVDTSFIKKEGSTYHVSNEPNQGTPYYDSLKEFVAYKTKVFGDFKKKPTRFDAKKTGEKLTAALQFLGKEESFVPLSYSLFPINKEEKGCSWWTKYVSFGKLLKPSVPPEKPAVPLVIVCDTETSWQTLIGHDGLKEYLDKGYALFFAEPSRAFSVGNILEDLRLIKEKLANSNEINFAKIHLYGFRKGVPAVLRMLSDLTRGLSKEEKELSESIRAAYFQNPIFGVACDLDPKEGIAFSALPTHLPFIFSVEDNFPFTYQTLYAIKRLCSFWKTVDLETSTQVPDMGEGAGDPAAGARRAEFDIASQASTSLEKAELSSVESIEAFFGLLDEACSTREEPSAVFLKAARTLPPPSKTYLEHYTGRRLLKSADLDPAIRTLLPMLKREKTYSVAEKACTVEERLLSQFGDNVTVLYHSAPADVACFYLIISAFERILTMSGIDSPFTRLRATDLLFGTPLSQVLQNFDVKFQGLAKKTGDKVVYNNMPDYPELITSWSPWLFAGHMEPITYEKEGIGRGLTLGLFDDEISNTEFYLYEKLKEFFSLLGINDSARAQKYSHLSDGNLSLLLQLFIPLDVLDKCGYMCEMWGERVAIRFNTGESPTYQPSRFIRELCQDPKKLEGILCSQKTTFKNPKQRENFGYVGYIEALQTRLYMDMKSMGDRTLIIPYVDNKEKFLQMSRIIESYVRSDVADLLLRNASLPPGIYHKPLSLVERYRKGDKI